MDFRISYRVKEIGTLIGVVILFFAVAAESMLMAGLGIVLEVFSIGQALVYYRCPYCKSLFPIREKPSNFCPECGRALE